MMMGFTVERGAPAPSRRLRRSARRDPRGSGAGMGAVNDLVVNGLGVVVHGRAFLRQGGRKSNIQPFSLGAWLQIRDVT